MNDQIKQAIETFKQKVFDDYEAFQYGMWKRDIEKNPERKKGLHEIAAKSIEEFKNGFRMEETKYYYKFLNSSSGVHSFIVKEDKEIRGKKWKQGDILKPADYRTPALNRPRGNILGEYVIQWEGPLYLR